MDKEHRINRIKCGLMLLCSVVIIVVIIVGIAQVSLYLDANVFSKEGTSGLAVAYYGGLLVYALLASITCPIDSFKYMIAVVFDKSEKKKNIED